MKSIWMMAAVAALAACAGRGEDEMGAAPDRGDTTAVTTGADTTTYDTTYTGGVGQTGDAGMVPDTVGTATDSGYTQEYPTTPAPGATTDTLNQTGTYPSDSSMENDSSATGGYDTTGGYGADTTSMSGGVETTPPTDTNVPGTLPSDSSTIDPTTPSADSIPSNQ